MLINKVNIIFHVAASVRLKSPLLNFTTVEYNTIITKLLFIHYEKKYTSTIEKIDLFSLSIGRYFILLKADSRIVYLMNLIYFFRFDDPLSLAVKLNLRGTREIVELAKEVKDLKVS